MARHVVTERDLKLLGYPTKEETLALVGWLALCNAFGQVTAEDYEYLRRGLRGNGLPAYVNRWVGEIMATTGRRGHRKMTNPIQDTVGNRKRKVVARRSRVGLTT